MSERCVNDDCPNVNSRWCWACQYYLPTIVPDPTPEPKWSATQWDYIIQLRAMVNHLNNKVTELRANKIQKEVPF